MGVKVSKNMRKEVEVGKEIIRDGHEGEKKEKGSSDGIIFKTEDVHGGR